MFFGCLIVVFDIASDVWKQTICWREGTLQNQDGATEGEQDVHFLNSGTFSLKFTIRKDDIASHCLIFSKEGLLTDSYWSFK
jgi:hypothetical protein